MEIKLDVELQPEAIEKAAAKCKLVNDAAEALREGMDRKLTFANSSGEVEWSTPVASLNAPAILGTDESIQVLNEALTNTAGDSKVVVGRFVAEKDPKNPIEVDIYFRPHSSDEAA